MVNGVVLAYLLATSLRALRSAAVLEPPLLVSFALTVLLAVLAALSYLILRRRIVAPIRRLLREARLMHSDEPDGFFSIAGDDEISRLAAGFNQVLARMRQALADLDGSNRALLAARQQIQGSLDTASLLQRSILPGRQLEELFGGEHCLLWLPRDEVGGDSYLVHRDRHLALVGVADCAGHGVSGAMMTMLARAALDRAIQEEGLQSPAALLHRTDAVLRVLLGEADTSRAVATSMDLGLLLIDGDQGRLRFAGARIALHWSDGRRIREQRGTQHSLAEPRPGRWEDHEIPFARDATYTMSTDGLLDQGGGDGGFSLGREGYERWLLELAALPPSGQLPRLRQLLEDFRGEHPQRDDITLLAFRLMAPPGPQR